MSSLYWKWDNAITPERCQEIIDSAGDTFETAFLGDENRTDNKTRKTNIYWSQEQELFDMVGHYGASANRQAEWNLQTNAMESIQIGQYPTGGHYDWHVDGLGLEPIDAPENELLHGKTRKISFVLWLNDDFEGGDFEFHSAHIKGGVIKPKQGTILLFPSWVMHRVKPVKKGTRYSAVSWLVGKPVR
jgi:PKHD-type hydroxylase